MPHRLLTRHPPYHTQRSQAWTAAREGAVTVSLDLLWIPVPPLQVWTTSIQSQVVCRPAHRNITHSGTEYDPPPFGTSPTLRILLARVSNALKRISRSLTLVLTPNKHRRIEDIFVDNRFLGQIGGSKGFRHITHRITELYPPRYGTSHTVRLRFVNKFNDLRAEPSS